MSNRARSSNSKLSRAQLAVAERLKTAREEEGFSLGELAAEIGVSKSNLAHWQYGRAPLPFVAGEAICRRLDWNQRWLATGEEPQRPFVDLAGLTGDEIDRAALGKLTLHTAITGPLREVFARWRSEHDDEKLGAQTFRDGLAAGLRRQSDSGLEALLSRFVSELRGEKSAPMKLAHAERIEAALRELRRRMGGEIDVDQRPPMGELSVVQIKKLLRQTRERLGLTREQAATKWDIPVKTLEKWETGERKPRGLSLRQLETILRTAGVE